jgi:hypothetical protein
MAEIGNLLDPLSKGKRFLHKSDKKIVFLTFTNKHCEKHANNLILQAKSLKFFDEIIIEKDFNKDIEFKNALKNPKFASIYSIKNGYGFWLWKPYIIYKHLKKLTNNDILIYSDPGGNFPVNPILKSWAKNKLNEYFIFLDKNNGCMSFESGFAEHKTTKMEVFDFFDNYDIENTFLTQSRISNLHFIKKTDFSVSIYNKWWNIAKNHPYLFDDCICRSSYDSGIIETRNDQSVWSLLCKKMNVVIHTDNPSRRPIKVNTRPIVCDTHSSRYNWYEDGFLENDQDDNVIAIGC